MAFAWSFTIYLEQMFTAELYLWSLKWEQAVHKAQQENKPLPELIDVPRPSILDEVPDLLEKKYFNISHINSNSRFNLR